MAQLKLPVMDSGCLQELMSSSMFEAEHILLNYNKNVTCFFTASA